MSSITSSGRKEVRDVLKRLRELGLTLKRESRSGHVKVYDPRSGAFLFVVTSTPSDTNFIWQIKRHVRRLGFDWDSGEVRRTRRRARLAGAVDLEALARAQAAAASAGVRIPQLDDLDEHPEFLRRTTVGSRTEGPYTEAATEERIETMTMPASEAPRFRATVQRLKKFLVEHDRELAENANRVRAERGEKLVGGGKGGRTEFVRIAIEEVAPARGLRAWKTIPSGQQTMHNLVDLETSGAQLWTINLIEATMDHIEGLQWGQREELIEVPPALEPSAKEVEAEEIVADVFEEPKMFEPIVSVGYSDGRIREMYTEALLEILRTEGSATNELVLLRLDKLAGIA